MLSQAATGEKPAGAGLLRHDTILVPTGERMQALKRALEAARDALQLAIDAREMTMHEFQRKYEAQLREKGWITAELQKALRRVERAMR